VNKNLFRHPNELSQKCTLTIALFLGLDILLGQSFSGHVVRGEKSALGRSSRIRHRNQLTVKASEKAAQEQGNSYY